MKLSLKKNLSKNWKILLRSWGKLANKSITTNIKLSDLSTPQEQINLIMYELIVWEWYNSAQIHKLIEHKYPQLLQIYELYFQKIVPYWNWLINHDTITKKHSTIYIKKYNCSYETIVKIC